jgi:hypothetical protein
MLTTFMHELSRIRRNHALEHATIHVISQQRPQATLVGRSDRGGFFLYADKAQVDVQSAAQQALDRLRQGQHHLAVHPNCGTNLLTAAGLSAAAAYLSLLGERDRSWRDRLDRFPLAILGGLLALILAKPLGKRLQQRLTTQARVGSLRLLSVEASPRGRGTLYRVLTVG